jgi:hypothetical protein
MEIVLSKSIALLCPFAAERPDAFRRAITLRYEIKNYSAGTMLKWKSPASSL